MPEASYLYTEGKGKSKVRRPKKEKRKWWQTLLRSNSVGQPDRAHARTRGTTRNDFLVELTPTSDLSIFHESIEIVTFQTDRDILISIIFRMRVNAKELQP